MIVCDGDGLVINIDIINFNDFLRNVKYIILVGNDVFELYIVYIFKIIDFDRVFIKRSGLLSLCFLFFFVIGCFLWLWKVLERID